MVKKADVDKLDEFRIIKLASMSIVNLYDTYEQDLKTAEAELYAIDNPDKVTEKDFDNE